MNFAGRIQNWLDGFLPLLAQKDMDSLRHCRLIIAFGFLGSVFGLIYAAFYCAIGHFWGAAIIAICDSFFLGIPWMLRHTRRHYSFHGYILCTVLTFGFTSLAAIEGGVRGHAITWLATVPFCAVLLIGINASYLWCLVCMIITVVFSALDMRGMSLPYFYASQWHAAVTMAGYVGLGMFLFLLAHIFERGRLDAHQRMLQAYKELADATSQLVHGHEELERTNSQLEQANELLRQLNLENFEFIGIAAHVLKNPLTAVLGYSELLAGQFGSGADHASYGEKIKIAAERMLKLVTDLLDINAIEEGHVGLKMEQVDFGRVITQILHGQRMAAARKKIAIHLESPPAMFVIADTRAMLQVVENFISNAVKYSPEGRSVYVRVFPLNGEVTLEVEDEGPGLSEQDQAMLFQKYSRLTPQPTGGESSTGLGLSIVKRLAESMGARVGCRSELGRGTVFWITLRGYCSVAAA